MSAIELRPYQSAAIRAVEDEWASGHKRTLLVLPTGCGKTIVFAKLCEDMVRGGKRGLILAHRGELLDQAAEKIRMATGLSCAVEKAESTALDSFYRLTVGSVQSLMRESRLHGFSPDYYDFIVVDEAHHAASDSYRRILDHFRHADVLGVTATPDRGDMKSLGEVFDSLAYEYALPAAIREGYLSPIRAQTIPLSIDISDVSTAAGDFKPGEISTALDPYLDQIAQEMTSYCRGRRTVVFLPLVATSQKFCDILRAHGFRAAEVNGESEDREGVLHDFAAGRYDVLCNSMLLTEGWDCPAVDCIVPLRPTKVRALYAQMVGRGTRLNAGKDHLLLLDFLWHTNRHELCRPASLVCKNREVETRMTENLAESAAAVDVLEAEKTASDDVVQAREEALAKELSQMKKRKRRLVDPLQFEMSIAAEDLSGYEPAFGWEMAPPSDKQKAALETCGIFPDEITCAGKASLLLNRLQKRRQEGLTTPKQIRFLESRGFCRVGTWSFDDARKLIDRIAANGWRIPHGVDPTNYKPKEIAHGRA